MPASLSDNTSLTLSLDTLMLILTNNPTISIVTCLLTLVGIMAVLSGGFIGFCGFVALGVSAGLSFIAYQNTIDSITEDEGKNQGNSSLNSNMWNFFTDAEFKKFKSAILSYTRTITSQEEELNGINIALADLNKEYDLQSKWYTHQLTQQKMKNELLGISTTDYVSDESIEQYPHQFKLDEEMLLNITTLLKSYPELPHGVTAREVLEIERQTIEHHELIKILVEHYLRKHWDELNIENPPCESPVSP